MISKVKRVKCVGKFYDFSCQANELDWHKNTFLFAPNAYGKSTLVNVFRSLQRNDPKIIRARKTVNKPTPPEAVIVVDGANHIFKSAKWDKPCETIQIFDTHYIHANILTHEIEHEHRKNIHKIIIGAQGVILAQELADLKNQEKERRKKFGELQTRFQSVGFALALDAFLDIPASEETQVGGRIQKLEQDIKSKGSESRVRALSLPHALSSPTFEFSGLKTIASQRVAAVHEEAEKRVLAHISRNLGDDAQAKDFIRRGLDLLQADCPFCGQDLANAADLLAAYRQYFDNTFRAQQQRLVQHAGVFSKWNLDNELTMLVSGHHANTTAVKQWEAFVGAAAFSDIPAAVDDCRTRLAELKTKAQAQLERKEKDPHLDIDLSSLDTLASKIAGLKSIILGYNEAASAFNAKARDFIANLPKTDLSSIQLELTKEQKVQKRFTPEWKQWAADYRTAKKEAVDLLSQKIAKEKELEDYTNTIFDTYQDRINELLLY